MQRKILSVILSICVVLSVVFATPIIASADIECAVEDGLYYSVYDGKATIIGYDEKFKGDLIIPETLGGYPVTAIGDEAFFGRTGLTSISIPNSVTSIGERAFWDCWNLSIIIVDADNGAYCSVDGVLFNKDKTELVCYPEGKGETYVIPDGVISIGEFAFFYCNRFTSVSIPNSVTSIGKYAFDSCALTSIEIPNSVTSIGNSAFGFNPLTTVMIPSSVTNISNNTFQCCLLTSVTIPNSVTSIGDRAFSDCYDLETVYYGGTEEDKSKISIEEGNDYLLDAEWVYKEDNSKKLTYTVSNGKATVTGYDGELKGDLIIPETLGGYPVTAIGDEAFYDCDKLTSVEMPNSVTSIGEWAFDGCNIQYNEYDNALYLGNKTNKYLYLVRAKSDDITSCTINDNTRLIADRAFCGCIGLTSITIPDSVISIGNLAFNMCNNLTSVTLGSSVISIGSDAFGACGLTTITIPDSVTSIGNGAFFYCEALTSVTLGSSVISIGNHAFSCCTGLTSITIPDSVTSIGNGAFSGCIGLTSIEIPNSVTNIGDYAFGECSGLTSVVLPNSVTSIGNDAFFWCSFIETVYYDGTEEDKNKINIGYNNEELLNAEWVYKEEHTTHIYDDENDGVCNVCGEFRDFGSELLSIDVLVKPREIAYFVGKTFDPYGSMISAYFANGFYKIVQTDYTLSEIDTSTAGKKAVTVSWCGKTTEFYVDIIAPNAESLANLVGIILVQPKGHLSYDLNEDGVVDLIDLVQMKKMIAS